MFRNIINDGILDKEVERVREELKEKGFYTSLSTADRTAFNFGSYEMLWALHEAGLVIMNRTGNE